MKATKKRNLCNVRFYELITNLLFLFLSSDVVCKFWNFCFIKKAQSKSNLLFVQDTI